MVEQIQAAMDTMVAVQAEAEGLMQKHNVGTIEEAQEKEAAEDALRKACLANGAGAESEEVLAATANASASS